MASRARPKRRPESPTTSIVVQSRTYGMAATLCLVAGVVLGGAAVWRTLRTGIDLITLVIFALAIAWAIAGMLYSRYSRVGLTLAGDDLTVRAATPFTLTRGAVRELELRPAKGVTAVTLRLHPSRLASGRADEARRGLRRLDPRALNDDGTAKVRLLVGADDTGHLTDWARASGVPVSDPAG